MNTKQHFLLPRCTGMNCGATDANHSPECRAEHAAAVAGGRFVKDEKRAADDAERDALVIAEAALADIGDAEREPGDDLAWCERRAAQALPAVRAALSARADGGKDSSDARDAERYRWLSRKVSAHGVIDGWAFGFPSHLTLPAPPLAMRDPAAALGQAIDAAIAGEKK